MNKTSKCRVTVGFYKHTHNMYKSEKLISKFWTKMIAFWCWSRYTHCTIRLTKDEDNDLMLFAVVGKAAALANTSTISGWLGYPDLNIDLGTMDIDWNQVEKLVDGSYRGTVSQVLLWFFLTRFFSKWKPKTCTTCVCEILRAGKMDINIFVSPAKLLKELNHELNHDCRKSEGG